MRRDVEDCLAKVTLGQDASVASLPDIDIPQFAKAIEMEPKEFLDLGIIGVEMLSSKSCGHSFAHLFVSGILI